ncbi:MAG: 16S rRNA (cytidine(1402)-2'-O)-methyltransferase [Pseudomonadota bacterium]
MATPIGNLGDITVRALETLASCDVIACEDTRASRTLCDRYGISTPLTAYHDHNGDRARPALLKRLEQGQSVALISDAGTPLIADPGYKLVEAARDARHSVVAIPGPSAIITALSIAGLPTDRFLFAGFLPSKASARRRVLEELNRERHTLCFYEAPSRLADTLESLVDIFGGGRPARVARELTKRFETIQGETLAELADHYRLQEKPRGEIVILVGPAPPTAPDADELDAALRQALVTESLKDAAKQVAQSFGLRRRDVYQRALELTADEHDEEGD